MAVTVTHRLHGCNVMLETITAHPIGFWATILTMREKIVISAAEASEFEEMTSVFEHNEEHVLNPAILLVIQSS